MKQSIDTIKTWFRSGKKPTQQQFYDWLESFVHKDAGIEIANVSGLVAALNAKASAGALTALVSILYPFRAQLYADGYITIPAGMVLKYIIVSPAADSYIIVETVPGEADVRSAGGDDPDSLIAGASDKPVIMYLIAREETRLYLRGITSSTTVLMYMDTLTHSNA